MDKKEMLFEYIKINAAPILTDYKLDLNMKEIVKIPASINRDELTGHYDINGYKPPKWLDKILKSKETKILLIENIDKIAQEEQEKFEELLKYRKI